MRRTFLIRIAMILTVGVAVALALPMFAAPRVPRQAEDTVVIGEYGSFTGNTATFGIDTHEGIQLAVDEVNAAGGVMFAGIKLRVVLGKRDDESTAAGVETAVKKLLAQEPVVVLGEVMSGRSKVGGALCNAAGVPMISPCSTQPSVTQMGDFVFRACFIDPYQAKIAARFALDGLKAKKVAIFTNRDDDYSKGLSEDFKAAFTKYGGRIVGQQFYSSQDKNYKNGLRAIKALHPDALFVPGYYQDAGSICRQAREMGMMLPIVGGDGWSSDRLFQFGGDGLKNTYFTDHASVSDPSRAMQKFVAAFRKKYKGKTPNTLSMLGYDAARLAFDAMKRAKTNTPAAVRDALADTKGFAGVTGTLTFDADRNPQKSVVIIAPRDGKFLLKRKIIDPEKPLQ